MKGYCIKLKFHFHFHFYFMLCFCVFSNMGYAQTEERSSFQKTLKETQMKSLYSIKPNHSSGYKSKQGYYSNSSNSKNSQNNGKSIEDIRKEVLPDIGNFALPTSQQPGAFVSIGQNVIDKNQKQIWFFADAYVGPKSRFVDAIPGALYQPTDNLSLFLNVPYALDYRYEDTQSSGLEDIFCQAEYAYYNNPTTQYNDQATILGYVSAPTGFSQKAPSTGYGGVGYFLGTTFTRTYVDWIFFTSYGGFFSTKNNNTNAKYGNYYLYEFGIGKNICYIKSELIFNWLIEFDGYYYEKNNIDNELDPNSGGNFAFIVPSLWISTQNLIVQLGIGVPVYQEFHGEQNKFRYLWVANIGWTF
jgi:hypothetical protein